MSELVVLQLDRRAAGFLALSLRAVRGAYERQGRTIPDGVEDLEYLAAETGERGSELVVVARDRTSPDSDGHYDRTPGEAVSDGTVSQTEAARVLEVSTRTIRRMLDRGELEHTLSNGRRRVTRAGLHQLSQDLRPAGATVRGGRP